MVWQLPGRTVRGPDETGLGLADLAPEHALLLGAGSTVMYQLALRPVGLGVAEHSTTLTRPLDRLRTTLTYAYAMALGTEAEREAVARMVNRVHAPVQSEGRYSAYDPELQLWVAATLARNAETIHERVFGRLDGVSRERVLHESRVFGTALQVPEESWPRTTAEFEAYWSAMLDRLEPDPAVRAYARRLLSASGMPVLLRPAVLVQSLVARGNLDPRTREVLGLPWSPRDQRRYDAFWRVFPPAYRLVPRRLRHAYCHHVLRGMRRRIRAGRRVI